MSKRNKIIRPDTCPVSDESRDLLEKSFLQLIELFGKETIVNREVLVPHLSSFPIQYDGTVDSALETLNIITNQMDIDFNSINLEFYDNSNHTINSESRTGSTIHVQSDDNSAIPAGQYYGKNKNEQFDIAIGHTLLYQPENMVATIAHELAHVKLLGEGKIEDNDEILTELTTIIFGLGIFNANAAFQTAQNNYGFEWQSIGYLTQMEWGYALSLFAQLRNEITPSWIDYLTINIQGDFIQAQNYITASNRKIFDNI